MPCPLCDHPKREAIDAAIAQHRRPGVIAQQFRLDAQGLQVHMAHQDASNLTTVPTHVMAKTLQAWPTGHLLSSELEPFEADPLTLDPLRATRHYLQEAARYWRMVDRDRRTPGRLQLLLDETFAEFTEHMGL